MPSALALGATALVATEALVRTWSPAARQQSREVVRHAATNEIDDGLVVSGATSVSQALCEFWETASRKFGVEAASVDPLADAVALAFPACDDLDDERVWSSFFAHLECCKDVCDSYGSRLAAVPSSDGDARAIVVQRVVGRSGYEDEEDEDDDWDLSPELAAKLAMLGDEDDEGAPGAVFEENASDEAILATTKRWVDAIISGAGVCPFSVTADKAGLPVGTVRYAVSRAPTPEAAYADYWREVDAIQRADQRSLATTLLVLADKRWTHNLEDFEVFGTTLAQALETRGLGFENDLQLVFFHPLHRFRDGRDRAGADAAANYARRSPYPMVNILRTSQVREAQRGLPTALVYAQNEVRSPCHSFDNRAQQATLGDIGADQLDHMLRKRDWTPIDGKRVDRKAIEVLRVAQSLMRQADSTSSSE